MGGSSAVSERLAESSSIFIEFVWPLISPKFGAGRLVAVEQPDSAGLARIMDYLGIDYMFCPSQGTAFGISQRTQWTPTSGPWNSFTMSVKEYVRFREGMSRPIGQVLPAVIVQSFVTRKGARLLVDSVGVVRTGDLLTYAVTAKPKTRNGPTGVFQFWTFDELAAAGYRVERFPDPSLRVPFANAPQWVDLATA